jgi:hypothetical protein
MTFQSRVVVRKLFDLEELIFGDILKVLAPVTDRPPDFDFLDVGVLA